MKYTVVSIRQTCTTTHDFLLKVPPTEEQLDKIEAAIGKIDHPGDMTDVFRRAGVEIESYDEGGCWEGSEFEYWDDYEEEIEA